MPLCDEFVTYGQNLDFNPLLPIAHKCARIDKISILKLEGIIKKIPGSVATMSR